MADADYTDERMRDVAFKMRQVFFAEFGHPSQMTDQDQMDAIRSLVAIHAGELLEVAARFRKPSMSIRETAIAFMDSMLEHNAEEIAKLMGDTDKHAYLVGDGL